MFDDSRSFVTRAFLRAECDLDYRAYTDGEARREWKDLAVASEDISQTGHQRASSA